MFGNKKEKRSFFEKLSGATSIQEHGMKAISQSAETAMESLTEEAEEGQLSVDVYQTPSEIIIKTMVAGVHPEDLDVSIARDMITIRGKRESGQYVTEEDYFYQELYWGGFSRTILLPQEIDVDAAEATEKHGLLILKLPKLNKNKQTKVKIKSIE